MKKSILLIGLLLGGCMSGPVAVVYKPGSSFAERQSVADQCRIDSIYKIPQVMVTTVHPGHHSDGFIRCREIDDGVQMCREEGGFDFPETVSTRDVNADLRERYVASCLSSHGYGVIAKPICANGQAAGAYFSQRDRQASEQQIACVAEDERIFPDGWK
ncbi:hypothetical protein [Oryzibacter oryziterrae]|uniref:hypothetical protein n=1 Tax=Oryzibacter oryziterrae TaxID=2766474 RepID=UPI001F1B00E4|nr:hypothetical protein [Oryzibacter oryziterrae]